MVGLSSIGLGSDQSPWWCGEFIEKRAFVLHSDPAVEMSQLSTLGGFIAGALAACGAVTITNPMEVVKTRLQLQGELAAKGKVKKIYSGVFQALRIIAINEGIKGSLSGVLCLFRDSKGFRSCCTRFPSLNESDLINSMPTKSV